ncbi:hypothetical protein CR152_21250 [Massilia violaceinigra]|uniref:Uncharacterized protein n=1 Tax=Massilia violaceinigra TaxID=2045208 RepID=A0A2D2DP52_9BURK|nr:hypothetical protein CR152_21250 [Massilia violaceinigra]
MNVEKSVDLYGLRPSNDDQLAGIRKILDGETEKERRKQGDGDTELMKLSCIQLFSRGILNDILRIWSAKTASMDADCSIDIQLLCGAGLDATIEFLKKTDNDLARSALLRIGKCEATGDFEDFTIHQKMKFCEEYYS